MLVSVPCDCGAEIGPVETRCRACNAPVTRETREAIEAALEAAHSGYREARQQMRRSATFLLVVALMYLTIGLLAYVVSGGTELAPLTEEESRNRLTALIENLVIGGTLLGCHYETKVAPRASFLVALGIWVAARAAAFAAAPSAFFVAFLSASGVGLVMGKIIVFVLLIRGVLAAHRLEKLPAEIAGAPDQAPVADDAAGPGTGRARPERE